MSRADNRIHPMLSWSEIEKFLGSVSKMLTPFAFKIKEQSLCNAN